MNSDEFEQLQNEQRRMEYEWWSFVNTDQEYIKSQLGEQDGHDAIR